MSSPVLPQATWTPCFYLKVLAFLATTSARIIVFLSPNIIYKIISALVLGCGRPSQTQVSEWRNAAISVSKRCSGKGCLQLSVAVIIMGAMHRRTPVWCTGFSTEPFISHAWVEIEGKPVNEPNIIRSYHRILTVEPRWVKQNQQGEL